jgi:DNA-binding NarL/FixJ family response regulator
MYPKATIILCEDENLIALDLRNQLQHLGYNVLKICSTGEELIKSAKELKPDIIITDIQLRGKITGIDAIKIIKKYTSVPFVFLSGQQNPATFYEAMQTNPSDFISKPFSVEQLSRALLNCRQSSIVN